MCDMREDLKSPTRNTRSSGKSSLGRLPWQQDALEEGKAEAGNHGENSSKCQRYGELEQVSDVTTEERGHHKIQDTELNLTF